MTWQQELCDAVAKLKDEDWERPETVYGADLRVPVLRKTFTLRVGDVDLGLMSRLTGAVNNSPVGFLSPGLVRLDSSRWSREEGGSIDVTVSPQNWNLFLKRDGSWAVATDAKGQTAYPYADLNQIPSAEPLV